MKTDIKKALQLRRSYYALTNRSMIADEEIEDIVKIAVKYVPSAFNSQSTRIVLLLGEQHLRLWQLVKETLQKIVPEQTFKATEKKIDQSFAAGYGTVLFFEEQEVVEMLQKRYPLYQERFPVWAQHTSAMHQLVIWMLLEDVGFGSSLQHYNPLIDEAVKVAWELPKSWLLVAQMPFGIPLLLPDKKEFKPIDERIRVFK